MLIFFLRSFRSTVIIATAIPLSILATVVLVYAGGLTLNLMTLGGLALGIGMMVDSSIVVLENIFRHRQEENASPHDAARNGTQEVTTAIIASTITTLVIFLPLFFVTGVAGLLFQELAFVVVYALIAALLVALTVVPMLAARLLSQSPPATQDAPTSNIGQRAARLFTAFETVYADLLAWVLRHRLLTIGGSLLALAASLQLWPLLGSEFMPPTDEGQVRAKAEFEPGTQLHLANQQARLMEKIARRVVPETISQSLNVSASGRHGNAATTVDLRLNVGPVSSRQRSNKDIAKALRAALQDEIAGAKITTRAPQGQFLLSRILGGDEGIEVQVRGFDFNQLQRLAGQVSTVAENITGVTDVEDDIEPGVPQYHAD